MQVPGFKIEKTIGRGGMATVYLAIQESLERQVVLKIMNQAETDNTDFVDRFVNEGRIIASLQHPFIITIHDIGISADVAWIAMEYIEGGDLKSRLDRPMDPDDALDLTVKIASALGYAHEHGIVHRDVKPANILFRRDGTPLLSDFGIAKQVKIDSELTSTGTILGSPFYMSPEQSEGVQVDGRTDLYSLGVIFYEMLSGERPYKGDTAIKVIMQHIQEPIPKLPQKVTHFQPLLERMMAKDRDERVADAGELIREVQALREGPREDEGTGEEGETTGRVRRRRAGRRRTGVMSSNARLAVLAACALLTGVAIAGFYAYVQSLAPSPLLVSRPAQEARATNVPEPPPPPQPSAGGGSPGKQDVVKALEWLARNSLREDRLTQPPADNAYYYYSRLLALDPDNEAADEGFEAIAERFAVLAEQEYSNRNYGKAQAYVALGLQVQPNNEALKDLQSFIENRERTVLDTILGLFSAEG